MKITHRNGVEIVFDINKIVEAISKANIREEEKRIDEKITKIEMFVGSSGITSLDVDGAVDDYILQEYERLLLRKRQYRALRRAKTAYVSAMIKSSWMNRNKTAGRSRTLSVEDPMLQTIPTPPTSVTVMNGYRSGGAVIALAG